MIILETKVLRGPNYWSNYRQNLIQLKLNIGDYEEWPTDLINGFADRLETLLPSMYEHRCSEGVPGGFFQRVRKGTWLGHVIEHVALELQTLAGMECGYGRTRSTRTKGVYHVVFAYTIEDAGKYAGEAATKLVHALAQNKPYDIAEDLRALKKIRERIGLGPGTQSIFNEAKNRKIPVRRLDEYSQLQLGYGCNSRKICAALTDDTCAMAVDLAGDKQLTRAALEANKIPVPKGTCISSEEELMSAITEIGFPIVIKPVSGNHGRGVATNINSYEEALNAFHSAAKISDEVIVEQFIKGADFRLLVINYKLVAAAQRIPAFVTGDGKSTIEQLIHQLNSDPRRGNGHENFLTRVQIDDNTQRLLAGRQLSLDSVLQRGNTVILKDTANLSTGGTSKDVTDEIHPDNIFMAEWIARLVGLNICRIDLIASDLCQPLDGVNGGVIEINASPGLRMHLEPGTGKKRNVAAPIVDMLYQNAADSRIPLVAVTGTNGKTTTTRLIAYMAQLAGYNTGFTTTDGIYLNDKKIESGDCSGPSSARLLLSDKLVEFAVLECARGGILRSGLGFDHCSASIITNISDDHLGLDEVFTLREMADVKSVVARSTLPGGYAILNADDDLVYALHKELDCNIAFSMTAGNERIHEHSRNGGLAITVQNGHFLLRKGSVQTRIARINEIPMTLDGRLDCMIANILPAILATVTQNISIPVIREALKRFQLSPEQAPGRMNLFQFENFQLFIDYAHNPAGFNMLKNFLAKSKASYKTGIIAAPGDRRDEDIIKMGQAAAEMFDDIIIRHDKNSRGRKNEEITQLLQQGIRQARGTVSGIIISDEQEAISHAVNNAVENSMIIVCTDEISGSITFVKELAENQHLLNKKIMEQNY
ncbi:MAG: cyanophycin synthetase [Chitinophagaceae bacterium]|nr:cyanophycin synthetase [Chitinophagaceae bacterium]